MNLCPSLPNEGKACNYNNCPAKQGLNHFNRDNKAELCEQMQKLALIAKAKTEGAKQERKRLLKQLKTWVSQRTKTPLDKITKHDLFEEIHSLYQEGDL